MFDAVAQFVCKASPQGCPLGGEPVTIGLRELTRGVWEVPSPRCQCNLSLEMEMVSLAGNPV